MPYPYPYKFSDWRGYNRKCPDATGSVTWGIDNFLTNRQGYESGAYGSATGTSISKSLIGGVQTSGNAVLTAIRASNLQNNVIYLQINNGSETGTPELWNKLILTYSGGTTYTFKRSDAGTAGLITSVSYSKKDWFWTWTHSSGAPMPGGTNDFSWTITQEN
jgi:hypothetical protein